MRRSAAAGPRPAAGTGAVDPLGLAVVLGSVVALSTTSTLVKSAHAPGAVLGFWRLAVSSLVWQLYMVVRRRPLTRAEWKAVALPGICFGLNITFFFTGIPRTRVANAEFIGTLTPLIVLPFAARRLGEEVRRRTVILGASALVGVGLVVLFSGKGGKHNWSGDAFCVGAIMLWVVYLLTGRRVRQSLDTATFMAGMSVFAALTLFPSAAASGRLGDMTAHAWLVAVLLGLVAGVLAHGMLAWAQQHVPVSTITLLQLLQPALGTTWAFLFLDEQLRAVQVVGMVVVLVSVAAIVRGAMRAAGPHPGPEPPVTHGTGIAGGARGRVS